MTVIVWDGTSLSSDTMLSSTRGIKKFRKKIFKQSVNGITYLVGSSGNIAACDLVLDWFFKGHKKEEIPTLPDEQEAALLVIRGDKKVFLMDTVSMPLLYDSQIAIGIGAEIALGAMYMGADSRKAVEAAIHWNSDCGGEIETLTF